MLNVSSCPLPFAPSHYENRQCQMAKSDARRFSLFNFFPKLFVRTKFFVFFCKRLGANTPCKALIT